MDAEEFKFKLGQAVEITVSGEKGEIVGQARYARQQNSYLVRYKAADGRAVEAWWDSSALKEAE